MKGMLHIYNDCTIDWHQVQYVQICEAVWTESRTQSTTSIRDTRTDGRTHRHESYVPRLKHSPIGGQQWCVVMCSDVWCDMVMYVCMLLVCSSITGLLTKLLCDLQQFFYNDSDTLIT